MPSFGEKLKQEREKRKITLEQISASTKIGTRMLQALEEDKFSHLPGGIFNKGFVRAYARVVGLDEDQAVAEYLQASGDAPRTDPSSREPGSREAGSREDAARDEEERISRLEAVGDAPARPLPWGLFAAVLLVIALALSLWSRRQREHARLALHPEATAVTTTTQPPAAPLSDQSSGTPANAENAPASPASAPPAPDSSKPDSSKPGSFAASPVIPPTTGSVAPSAPQSTSSAAPAAAPGEFTVAIKAREESWILITADGKTTPSEVLTAGSERTVHARKAIAIKTGNAGGVDFLFNGKKLNTAGESGEVKTVTFGPAGLLPSPAPPSTP
ncbi:MAG: RodZ domain-containing protein [Terriglobales bacterium]